MVRVGEQVDPQLPSHPPTPPPSLVEAASGAQSRAEPPAVPPLYQLTSSPPNEAPPPRSASHFLPPTGEEARGFHRGVKPAEKGKLRENLGNKSSEHRGRLGESTERDCLCKCILVYQSKMLRINHDVQCSQETIIKSAPCRIFDGRLLWMGAI